MTRIPNAGERPIDMFPAGRPEAFYSTGLGGSQGTKASEGAPPLATVAVSIPGASSQAPIPTADVNIGDTFSMSGDRQPPMWAGNHKPQDLSLPWVNASAHVQGSGNPNAGGK